MTFRCARAVLLIKDRLSNSWREETVVLDSVVALRGIFHPHEGKVEQIDIDRNRKIYTCIEFLDVRTGIDAKFLDRDGALQILVSPILLVHCDEEKPIDMTDDVLRSMKEMIDFS